MPAIAENRTPQTQEQLFGRFAWSVLAYNVAVVLWGAYVRASGSGAGCGSHWPLCNGEVLPVAPRIETLIEFTHRLMSGVSLAAVGMLWWWSRRIFPRGHRGRTTAALALVFLLLEALLGAGLVLFRYVARDASAGRALYLSAHLTNTQILLGMLTATAWLADRPGKLLRAGSRAPAIALAVTLLAGISGAIAALGDTLYPASSLGSGLASEFSAVTPMLLRLRIVHPAIALAAALCVMFLRKRLVVALAAIQLAAGVVNWVLLAPVWMQILHLLLADLLWIALVVRYLEERAPASEMG